MTWFYYLEYGVNLSSKLYVLAWFCFIANSSSLFCLADGTFEVCFAAVDVFVSRVHRNCKVLQNECTIVGGRAIV